MSELERRVIETDELRAERDGRGMRLVGYAALFNVLSQDLGGFYEEVAPGAFAKSLNGDVRGLYNHDPNFVLGRTTNGTLQLREDSKGLLIDLLLPDVGYARDLWKLVERGDVSQMSFGFRIPPGGDKWSKGSNGLALRKLVNVELGDVSPVTFPAYEQTIISARSARQMAQEIMSEANNGDADGIKRRHELELLDLS